MSGKVLCKLPGNPSTELVYSDHGLPVREAELGRAETVSGLGALPLCAAVRFSAYGGLGRGSRTAGPGGGDPAKLLRVHVRGAGLC